MLLMPMHAADDCKYGYVSFVSTTAGVLEAVEGHSHF